MQASAEKPNAKALGHSNATGRKAGDSHRRIVFLGIDMLPPFKNKVGGALRDHYCGGISVGPGHLRHY